MLFYSDVEPQSFCQIIGPDGSHCLKIGFNPPLQIVG